MTGSTLKQIAVAIDGSEDGDRALEFAADLASRYGATLTLVTVVPPMFVPAYGGPIFEPPNQDAVVPIYDKVLSSRKERLAGRQIPRVETVRREGVVVEELLAYLESSHPDLFVVGSRGLSTGRRLLLGSVSDALVHHATCPVLVVRRQ